MTPGDDEVTFDANRAVDGMRRAIESGRGAVSDLVDDLVGGFIRRRVERAIERGHAITSDAELVRALDPSTRVASTASTIRRLSRFPLLRRAALLRGVAARTPTGRLVALAPVLIDATATNVGAIDAVAGRLASIAADREAPPDPVRIARATAQALVGDAIDPASRPDHGRLLATWLSESGRRLAPFGLRRVVPSRVHPSRVVGTLQAVDPNHLTAT